MFTVRILCTYHDFFCYRGLQLIFNCGREDVEGFCCNPNKINLNDNDAVPSIYPVRYRWRKWARALSLFRVSLLLIR